MATAGTSTSSAAVRLEPVTATQTADGGPARVEFEWAGAAALAPQPYWPASRICGNVGARASRRHQRPKPEHLDEHLVQGDCRISLGQVDTSHPA